MTRRNELEGWILATRRLQRRLALTILGGLVIALGLAFWHRPVGVVAVAILGLVAVTSFWVTSSHLADWRARLERVRRAA